MSQMLIGILGIVLIVGCALMATSYLGPAFLKSRDEARVADYDGQTTQLRRAANEFMQNGGDLPLNGTVDPISTLANSKNLRSVPEGARTGWVYNPTSKALLMRADGAGGDANAICIAARRKANIPNPTVIKKCDGSTGALLPVDPCCVG